MVLRLQIIELLLKYKAFFHYLEGTSMAETIMTCNASHQSYFRRAIARFYLSSVETILLDIHNMGTDSQRHRDFDCTLCCEVLAGIT